MSTTIHMNLRELLKRRKQKKQEEADAFADYYVTTHGKMRPKPHDKMRRRHEDK